MTELILKEKLSTSASLETSKEASSNESVVAESSASSMQSTTLNTNDVTTATAKTGKIEIKAHFCSTKRPQNPTPPPALPPPYPLSSPATPVPLSLCTSVPPTTPCHPWKPLAPMPPAPCPLPPTAPMPPKCDSFYAGLGYHGWHDTNRTVPIFVLSPKVVKASKQVHPLSVSLSFSQKSSLKVL